MHVRSTERGFAMAVLLIIMGITAVWMTASLPAWKQQGQREKEAELAFRLDQYARAFALYQRKAGPGSFPPNIDFLVEGKFLRKKYKDPITGDDFEPVFGQPNPNGPGGAGQGLPLVGVRSKSTAPSIRILNGQATYNAWVGTAPPPIRGNNNQGPNGSPNGGPGRGPGTRPGGPGGGPGVNPGGRPGGGPGGRPGGPGAGQPPTGPGRGGPPVAGGPGRGRGSLPASQE